LFPDQSVHSVKTKLQSKKNVVDVYVFFS